MVHFVRYDAFGEVGLAEEDNRESPPRDECGYTFGQGPIVPTFDAKRPGVVQHFAMRERQSALGLEPRTPHTDPEYGRCAHSWLLQQERVEDRCEPEYRHDRRKERGPLKGIEPVTESSCEGDGDELRRKRTCSEPNFDDLDERRESYTDDAKLNKFVHIHNSSCYL